MLTTAPTSETANTEVASFMRNSSRTEPITAPQTPMTHGTIIQPGMAWK